MKTIKLPLIAAIVAAFAGTAVANNEPHQTQLALERARGLAASRTTVALYADRQAVSASNTYRATQDNRREARFEVRKDSHGQTYGVWVAAGN